MTASSLISPPTLPMTKQPKPTLTTTKLQNQDNGSAI